LVLGLILVYVPQRYIPRVEVTAEGNRLRKVRKSQAMQELDLGAVTAFVSKRVKTVPGMTYELRMQLADQGSAVLFEEDIMFGGSRWERFAESVAAASGKPLVTEYWTQTYDGTLLPIPQKQLAAGRKRGLLLLSVPIAVSCLAAGIFGMILTQRSFVVLGCASVFVNLALSFSYAFRHRRQFGKMSNGAIVIAAVLTLSIPYGTLYALFAFLFLGFRALMRL
jgi:hypothetical protein